MAEKKKPRRFYGSEYEFAVFRCYDTGREKERQTEKRDGKIIYQNGQN